MAAEGTKAAVDLAKSLGAQISLALRTPLLSWDETEIRTSRKGRTKEIHRSAAIPAWFVVGLGLTAVAYYGLYTHPGGTVADKTLTDLIFGPGPLAGVKF